MPILQREITQIITLWSCDICKCFVSTSLLGNCLLHNKHAILTVSTNFISSVTSSSSSWISATKLTLSKSKRPTKIRITVAFSFAWIHDFSFFPRFFNSHIPSFKIISFPFSLIRVQSYMHPRPSSDDSREMNYDK